MSGHAEPAAAVVVKPAAPASTKEKVVVKKDPRSHPAKDTMEVLQKKVEKWVDKIKPWIEGADLALDLGIAGKILMDIFRPKAQENSAEGTAPSTQTTAEHLRTRDPYEYFKQLFGPKETPLTVFNKMLVDMHIQEDTWAVKALVTIWMPQLRKYHRADVVLHLRDMDEKAKTFVLMMMKIVSTTPGGKTAYINALNKFAGQTLMRPVNTEYPAETAARRAKEAGEIAKREAQHAGRAMAQFADQGLTALEAGLDKRLGRPKFGDRFRNREIRFKNISLTWRP